MNFQAALSQLVSGEDLPRETMREVTMTVMTGEASPAQIGAMLVALRMKGESIDEITGAAEVMRELVTPVEVQGDHLMDLVGTGAMALTCSTSPRPPPSWRQRQARVAKHGNRSVSSSSGSSDVLETLGVSLDLTPEQIAQCIEVIGLGFMFAPAHHGAMKHAIGPRRELGMRTIFNVLGPLTNPAFVKRQVLGVYDAALCEPLARALAQLDSVHALVLHSDDGLDEISVAAPTRGYELKDSEITPVIIDPAALGHSHASLDGLQVDTAEASADLIRAVFAGAEDEVSAKARSIIALNAGAGTYVAGQADTLEAAVARAEAVMTSGEAAEKLKAFVSFTQAVSGPDAGAPGA